MILKEFPAIPIFLSSSTPKMKIFIKMINSDQIITSFGSDKILSLSFSHWITKKLAKSIATHNYSEGNRKENFKGDRTLLDYRVMVQHTGERKQKQDLVLVKHHVKQLLFIYSQVPNSQGVSWSQKIGEFIINWNGWRSVNAKCVTWGRGLNSFKTY